jgi:protein TonB
MLETLLESKSKKDRSAGGALVSVTAHSALIAAALYATAEVRVQAPSSREIVRPVYFPSARHLVLPPSPTTSRPKGLKPTNLVFVETHVKIDVASIISVGDIASKPGDFAPGLISDSGVTAVAGRGDSSPKTVLRAEQVERQVALVPGSAPPRYPETLRIAGVEGRVAATFVVDEHGRVEEESVQFVQSDNPLFDDAVRRALRRMRFIPAEIGGRKVRQLVQMPFLFTLAR